MTGFAKNTLWSMVGIAGVQLINIICNIFLARMLYPEIFGLLGMALAFYGLILVFQEAGMSSYLIYEKNLKNETVSTSFWLNVICSILLVILIILAAPYIGSFYGEPQVTLILYIMSIGMLFSGISITARALLIKKREFNTLAKIDLVSELISSIVAVSLAFLDYSLLAISCRLFIKPLISTILLLMIERVNIKYGIKLKYVKSIVPYSSKFLGSQLFIYLNNNIDYLIIGKLMGSAKLGFYTTAYQWSVMPRFYIAGAVNKVFFPEVTKIKEDLGQLAKLYLQVIDKVSFFTLPACIGLILISKEFIFILYGPKWLNTVPILEILLVAGAITSISSLGGSIINGLGRPEIEMRLNIFSFITVTIFIVIASFISLKVVVFAILFKTILFDWWKTSIVCSLLKLKMTKIIRTLLPNILSTLLMYSLGWIFKYALYRYMSELWLMVSTIVVCISIYTFFTYLLNRRMFKDIISPIILLMKKRFVTL
ncbi:lipopolysaccharide biosynthesis protein [Peribacillus frigoritolerans]|uniref:lipopolysaccharide biosynthesis protein n=1 Tax=Peribacillus frigoritolerans TaxID=450367 RepID=UPI0021A71CBF|nr:lipopolysaccharide biosynthesis protein [Peribacillus frigoritolerans]MCT1391446.1 lipopolysaccharide biosynthesis protein [Peribacillus frigoritolerans]